MIDNYNLAKEESSLSHGKESYMVLPASRRQKQTIYRRYTVHELVTPTKEGGQARFTVEHLSLGVKHPDEHALPETIQASMSRSSFCLSPFETDDSAEHTSRFRRLHFPVFDTKTSIFGSNTTNDEPTVSISCSNSLHTNSISKKAHPAAKRRKCEGISHKVCRNLKLKHHKKELSWRQILYLNFLLLLPVLGFAYILYPPKDVTKDLALDFSDIRKSLLDKLFGQDEAIAGLLAALNHLSLLGKETAPSVIIVTGGNGVGKTFTMSIISKNFPTPGQSQYLVLPPLPSHEAVMDRFLGSGPHLLVIDNVNFQAFSSISSWIKMLHKRAIMQAKILWIVLIFNVQALDINVSLIDDHKFARILENSGRALVSKLEASGLNLLHIHFSPLYEESIKKCIERALMQRGIATHNHSKHVNDIVQISEDKHQGCKRVWSRILALQIQVEA